MESYRKALASQFLCSNRTFTVLFAYLIAAAMLPSCTKSADTRVAEQAVAGFHRQLGLARYQEIYTAADPEFRNKVSEQDATAYFGAVTNKLGVVRAARLTNRTINMSTDQTLVALSYETEFVEGPALEEFIWNVRDSQAFLFRYNINSVKLVTK